MVPVEDIENPAVGVPIISADPRRYFQFAVDLFSRDFSAATGVGALSFEVVTPPFAERIIGEISPREAAVGQRTSFVYAVRNQSRPGQDQGFDRFKIDTPLWQRPLVTFPSRGPMARLPLPISPAPT